MEANKPLLSVIIPVYKVEAYLRQCVESVLNQTYRNLEVILIDDGSPDGCPGICEEYAARDPRVRVIHQENRGIAATRNVGLDAATGELITFVDSDDWTKPHMYETMVRMLLEKDLDMVICGADRIDDGVVLERLGRYFEDGAVVDPKEVFALCMQDKILAHCWNRLGRRHCLKPVRFPEGKIYEDVYASPMPFAYAVRPVGFLHEPLYCYRHNRQGITATASLREPVHVFWARKSLMDYARDHAPELEDACLARVVSIGVHACNLAAVHTELETGEIVGFFRENRKAVFRSHAVAFSLKLRVWLLIYMKPVYTAVYRLFRKGERS